MSEEKLFTYLQNILTSLNYPEVKVVFNDPAKILKGKSRLKLFTWILKLHPTFKNVAIDERRENIWKDKLIKSYSKLGIHLDESTLTGDISLKKNYEIFQIILSSAQWQISFNLEDTKNESKKIIDIYEKLNAANTSDPNDSDYSESECDFKENCTELENSIVSSELRHCTENVKVAEPNSRQTYEDAFVKFVESFNSFDLPVSSDDDLLSEHRKKLDQNISIICNKFSILKKSFEQITRLREITSNEVKIDEQTLELIKAFDSLIENSVLKTAQVILAMEDV